MATEPGASPAPPADIEALRQLVLSLQQEVREARGTQTQPQPTQPAQPVAHSMDASKLGRKPDPFNGSRKSRAVQSWIKSIDDYFELNPGQHSTPRRGVLTAASYLIDPAKADYNTYVESKGEFATWTAMKKWLNDTYNPVDPINTSRKNFFGCKQGPDESPDSYHRRFLDCKDLLDTPFEAENVIGRAVRLSWARADRDFTGSVGLGPGESDLNSVPVREWSKAFKTSVGSVYPS